MQSMYYVGLNVHKENDQLLREGCGGPGFCRRQDGCHAVRSGTLDETLPQPWTAAVEATVFNGWIPDAELSADKRWFR